MRNLESKLFAGILFFASLLSPALWAAEIPIGVFHQVAPGIFRGARPGHPGMEAIAKLGVKTDINLEDDEAAVAEEYQDARRLGIRFISKPMSGFWAPSDQTANEILSLLANPANYPIFIHCHHGEDRTGLIVGLYRVYLEHWTPASAYSEMLQLGFHRSLLPLNHYFETRTGYED